MAYSASPSTGDWDGNPLMHEVQQVLDRQEAQEASAGMKTTRQRTSLAREHAKAVVQEAEVECKKAL